MDCRLLEIIACQVCNGELQFNKVNKELVYNLDGIAYPLRAGVPVLLEEAARKLYVNENNG